MFGSIIPRNDNGRDTIGDTNEDPKGNEDQDPEGSHVEFGVAVELLAPNVAGEIKLEKRKY